MDQTNQLARWARISLGFRAEPRIATVRAAIDSAGPEAPSSTVEEALIDAFTNGETYFLRHHKQLDWLSERLSELAAGGKNLVRVLCAGCSTGEEVWSMAAVVGDVAERNGLAIEIVGVDVNPRALRHANRGRYGAWSLRGPSRLKLPDWLSRDGDRIQVADRLRRRVRFVAHNLMEPLPRGLLGKRFDIVTCRNAMLYMHPEATQRVWTNLSAALSPDGITLTAAADPGPPASLGLERRWDGDLSWYAAAPKGEVKTTAPRGLIPRTPSRPSLMAGANEQPPPVGELLAQVARRVETGDAPGAVRLARQAVSLDPDAPYAIFLLAHALERSGDSMLAGAYYRRAAALLAGMDRRVPLEYAEEVNAGQLAKLLDVRSRRVD